MSRKRTLQSVRRPFAVALAIAAALVFASPGAQAEELGARAFGMGGAHVAVGGDLATIVHNPARLADNAFEVGIGLGANDLAAITSFYSLLTDPSEFDEDARLRLHTLSGVAVNGFGIGLAAEGELDVDAGCATADLCAEGSYMTQILLGAGRQTAGLPLNLAGLRVGGTLKRLTIRHFSFSKTEHPGGYDTATEDWVGQGYSLDLGVALDATEVVALGLTVTDVLSTLSWNGQRTESQYDLGDVLLASTETSLGSRHETLDPVYRAGVALRPPGLGLVAALDLASDGTVRYGVEKNLFANLISLRAGQVRTPEETTTTLGLGLNFGPARIDTAVGSADGFQTFTTVIEGSVRF